MEFYSVYTDGASRGNPGEAAAGFILKDSAGIVRLKYGNKLGKQTNNFAEYSAVVLALERIKTHFLKPGLLKLKFNLDSQVVAEQLKGKYKVKSRNLSKLFEKIKALENNYERVEYAHVPRTQNKEADKLVNEMLDKKAA